MAQVLVRDLSDETLDALKARAKTNHRSTSAEIRAILDEAARAGGEATPWSIWDFAGAHPTTRTAQDIVDDVRALRDEGER